MRRSLNSQADVMELNLSPADLTRLGHVIADRLANQPMLVDMVELAPLINVSVETVKRYTKSGLIPCIRIGRRVLYQPEMVIAALSLNETGAADE